jgi:hypothetical protein
MSLHGSAMRCLLSQFDFGFGSQLVIFDLVTRHLTLPRSWSAAWNTTQDGLGGTMEAKRTEPESVS